MRDIEIIFDGGVLEKFTCEYSFIKDRLLVLGWANKKTITFNMDRIMFVVDHGPQKKQFFNFQ